MMASKFIWKRWNVALGVLCVCAIAGGCLLLSQSGSKNRIIASCCDCETTAPTTLNEIASARFRKSYSGIGSIGPSVKGPIPYAVFNADGVDLLWTGSELVRRDYPFSGFSTTWTFTDGEKVSSDLGIHDGSAKRLGHLLDLLGQK